MLRKILIRIVSVISGVLFLFLVSSIVYFGLFYLRPADRGGQDIVVTIPEGLPLWAVASGLEKQGIITDKTLFVTWIRLMGFERTIKAGEYSLSSNMSPAVILQKLTKGIILVHPITIPEGYSSTQIAEVLHTKGLVKKKQFLSLIADPRILQKHGIAGPSLEGYLYPDTYQFARGLSAESIIDSMVRRFHDVIGSMQMSILSSHMTLGEIITLASIVEKETGKDQERPIIASVFLNRLKKGMRLESDPTVIYGIPNFNGNLTKKDLKSPTPYNTYVIRGLPKGPIANPGLSSIEAVLNPSRTEYLFFVSKNDGSHYFSKSLSEHNRAVTKYQKQRSSYGRNSS